MFPSVRSFFSADIQESSQDLMWRARFECFLEWFLVGSIRWWHCHRCKRVSACVELLSWPHRGVCLFGFFVWLCMSALCFCTGVCLVCNFMTTHCTVSSTQGSLCPVQTTLLSVLQSAVSYACKQARTKQRSWTFIPTVNICRAYLHNIDLCTHSGISTIT